MRIFLILSAFFILVQKVWATSPLPVVELTPALVKELGFRISFEVSAHGTTISVAAPSKINECAYRGSGVELSNADGNVIAGTYNNVSTYNEESHITGYIKDSTVNMNVSATYICLPNSGKRGKIYMVSSVSEYLVSTQK